jgi:flagellar protein FliS
MQPMQNKYLETSMQTASPAQLLIMLYDGAIRFCKQAVEAISRNDLVDAHRFLGKTQDIISEFVITLDQKSPFAEDLNKLYDYFLFRLTEANMKKTAEPIEEVLSYLTEMKQTWVEAAQIAKSPKVEVKHG